MLEAAHVINLPDRPERMASAARELETAGISYERVEAIDGATLSDELLQTRYRAKRARKKGEYRDKRSMGCCLSHQRALITAREKGKTAFIVEDDVAFPYGELTKRVLSERKIPEDWQMLLLGAKVQRANRARGGVVRATRAVCAHAYIVREPVLSELIELFAKPVAAPDTLWQKVLKDRKAYALEPPLAVQRIDMCESYKNQSRKGVWWTDERLVEFRGE